ncbi:MAG TPA: co-chaperone GroES [Planctomycetes bacterium]|nr:co-chaperone GroES [Planctomycetota bacterium]
MKIRPIDDRVVIKILEAEETTPGGLVLPDTAKEKPQKGEVIAVGPGKIQKDGKRSPMELEKGDVVIFGKYSGSDVKIGGEDFKIMRESEVLARLQGESSSKKARKAVKK